MRVTPLPDVEPRPRRVAVGTFDGVHLGHREVIRGSDTVLTFDPHPVAVLHPEAAPKLLDSFPIKRDLVASLGVEELVVIPGHGVYAATVDGGLAAVSVGVRPTFETGRGVLVEAHLIDFEGDLYGETLRIAFVERMRGEKRFDSVHELVEQMHADVAQAREICAETPLLPFRRS